jgi:hypothetical protein
LIEAGHAAGLRIFQTDENGVARSPSAASDSNARASVAGNRRDFDGGRTGDG